MRSSASFVTLFILAINIASTQAFFKNPFEKKYTPLIMFKVPKGTIPECDDMEEVVKSVEKDLNVKVEKMDILRDRFARNLYEKIDEIEFQGKVPLLYNRESRQMIYGCDSKQRVRAWAKGRLLSPKASGINGQGSDSSFLADEEQVEMGQFEEGLTELQQEGKERMQERMEG